MEDRGGGHRSCEPLVPVDALSRMAARFRGQQDPLPSARKLGTGRFSIAVLQTIDKCLELEPRDRPADCGQLLALLLTPKGPGRKVGPRSGEAEEVDERILQHTRRIDDLVEEIESIHAQGIPGLNRLDSRTWMPAIKLTYHLMAKKWLLSSRRSLDR